MHTSTLNLPDGMSIRPAHDNDKSFIESLYSSTRDDLRLMDAPPEIIQGLIQQQFNAQMTGYGEQFPNAFYFIVEKQGERIGRIVVDFGPNEVRIVDIAFVPQARGRGYGRGVLRAMKQAAVTTCVPLVLTVYKDNFSARRLYEQEGFRVEQSNNVQDLMAWYPGA